jgi:hypothetical protein
MNDIFILSLREFFDAGVEAIASPLVVVKRWCERRSQFTTTNVVGSVIVNDMQDWKNLHQIVVEITSITLKFVTVASAKFLTDSLLYG